MDGAGDRQPVQQLLPLHRVAAGQYAARLREGRQPAAQDLGQGFAPELRERVTDQVHGGQYRAAHRPHVGQGVDRGDTAEGVGVVDHRRKEIGGVDDCDVVRHPDHSGVVGVLDAHQNVFGLEPRQAAQDLFENALGEFGAATAVCRASGQLDLVLGCDRVEGARDPTLTAQSEDRLRCEIDGLQNIGKSLCILGMRLEHHPALRAHRPRRRYRIHIEPGIAGRLLGAHHPLHRPKHHEQIPRGHSLLPQNFGFRISDFGFRPIDPASRRFLNDNS